MKNRKIAEDIINFIINLKRYVRTQMQTGECSPITEQQFRTLMHLRRLEKCTLKELSQNVHISSSSVCIMLNKLWEEGLVNRENDKKDRRNTFYSLSDNGKMFLDNELEKKLSMLEKKVGSLSQDKKEKLANCIKDLQEILEELK